MKPTNKVLVGTFSERDLAQGKDKEAVKKAKVEHDLKYTETALVKKGGKIVGIKIWVCDFDTFTLKI